MTVPLELLASRLAGYRLSENLVAVEADSTPAKPNGKIIIFHSLFGQPMTCSTALVELLAAMINHDSAVRHGAIESNQVEDCLNAIDSFKDRHFLVQIDEDERTHLRTLQDRWLTELDQPGTLRGITFVPSELCNFTCSYCIQKHCREPQIGDAATMSVDDATRWTDAFFQYLSQSRDCIDRIWLNFNGGEPLLAFDVVQAVVARCRENHRTVAPDASMEFHLSTNLSRADTQVRRFLRDNEFTIYTSLDGQRMYHDRVCHCLGAPTYDLIWQRLCEFRNDGFPIDRVSVTVTDANRDGVTADWLHELHDFGISGVGVDYDLVHALTISADEVVEHLQSLCKAAWDLDMIIRGNWSDPFTYLLNETPERDLVAFCEPYQLRSFTIGPSGDVSLCPFIHDPVARFEDFVREGRLNSAWRERIEGRLPGRQKRCVGCTIEGICGGGCQGTISIGDAKILTQWCDIYHAMTEFLLQQRGNWYVSGLRHSV